MRLLLDEMLDRRLRHLFGEGVEAMSVAERGWDGKKNGELLDLAQHEFDALLTMDRGMRHQQDIEGLDLVIVVLRARSNLLRDTAPLVDEVTTALTSARPGTVVQVSGDASS